MQLKSVRMLKMSGSAGGLFVFLVLDFFLWETKKKKHKAEQPKKKSPPPQIIPPLFL